MAETMPFAGGTLVRPLLNIKREQIEATAKNIGLEWVEDESNQDTRYDRNFYVIVSSLSCLSVGRVFIKRCNEAQAYVLSKKRYWMSPRFGVCACSTGGFELKY